MQLLLRKLSTDSSGFQEYLDSEIITDDVLVGSSPQCDIQLLDSGIAPVHARLKKVGDQIELVAEKGRQFRYNGTLVRRAALQVDDEIQLGAQTFCGISAPAGFDFALEWRAVDIPGHLLANAYQTRLEDIRFSPRQFAWVLAVTIVLLAGIVPVMDYFWQSGNDEATSADHSETAMNATASDNSSRHRPALQSFWLSGPMLSAHQVTIGNDCGTCHQTPFIQVANNACEQCHTDMQHHLPKAHPDFSGLGASQCQDCHKEHNEPQRIISDSDGLCVDCHADTETEVTGFSQEAHPAFARSVLRPQISRNRGVLNVNWQRKTLPPDVAGEEINHLKFPHDLHLDPEAVTHDQRGDALQCADCHQLKADREHFKPIAMEQHCADCHDLSFDRRNPQKQLPHGSPSAVYEALEAYYVGLAFGPDLELGFERRRVPGREWQDNRCQRDYECAKEQAKREAAQQFSQRGCVSCHQVEEAKGAEGGERWQVLPVKLNSDWHGAARFDHQSHLTQARQEGNALCLSCHRADKSDTSGDILIPGRKTCTNCHRDKAAGGRVALSCIACHGYHDGGETTLLSTIAAEADKKQSPSNGNRKSSTTQ